MHTQLQLEKNSTDPWLPCGYNVITEEIQINKFEDNFSSQFFAKLSDSDEYLAILGRYSDYIISCIYTNHQVSICREKVEENQKQSKCPCTTCRKERGLFRTTTHE